MAFSKKGQTPPGMLSAASSQLPTTLQQLSGAFSSPRQINGNSIPGSPGIDIGTAPYCHRLGLRLNPLTPNTTCPVAPMQSPPTNHITTTMQPRPFHGGFPGKPRTLSLFPLLLSPAWNTYIPSNTFATRIHKPYRNHYRPTPHPRRLPPSCLTPSYQSPTNQYQCIPSRPNPKKRREKEAHAPHHNYYRHRQHIHPYSNH